MNKKYIIAGVSAVTLLGVYAVQGASQVKDTTSTDATPTTVSTDTAATPVPVASDTPAPTPVAAPVSAPTTPPTPRPTPYTTTTYSAEGRQQTNYFNGATHTPDPSPSPTPPPF